MVRHQGEDGEGPLTPEPHPAYSEPILSPTALPSQTAGNSSHCGAAAGGPCPGKNGSASEEPLPCEARPACQPPPAPRAPAAPAGCGSPAPAPPQAATCSRARRSRTWPRASSYWPPPCSCSAPASSSSSSCSTPRCGAAPPRPRGRSSTPVRRDAGRRRGGGGEAGLGGHRLLPCRLPPPVRLAQRLPGHPRGCQPDLRAPEQQRLHLGHRAAHR